MGIRDFFEWWDELEKNLGEAMDKKENAMSIKKALRIPVAPKGFSFKDKSKYSRKEKHKKKDF